MTRKRTFRLRCYDESPDTAYLELPDHPHELIYGIVARTVDFHTMVDNYNGPRLSIDFDSENRPIGIEIIYPTADEDRDH